MKLARERIFFNNNAVIYLAVILSILSLFLDRGGEGGEFINKFKFKIPRHLGWKIEI
jgi:hypothetical protein